MIDASSVVELNAFRSISDSSGDSAKDEEKYTKKK